MCYFYGYKVSRGEYAILKDLERRYGLDAAMQVLYDGFRFGELPTIIPDDTFTDIVVKPMHWEFIPVWIKDMTALKEARKQGIPWLNATADKLLESKMFRNAALKRRCLVPATHFFEWRHYKPAGAAKELSYPYIVQMADESPFYMAGIWQPWTDKETGETMDTFAIVTTKANELMLQVHNKKKRMPTILPQDLAWEWIMTKDISEERIQQIASFQLPSEQMQAHPIAKDFKTAADPLCPFEYEDLPELDLAL